jgi:hypothetical protein
MKTVVGLVAILVLVVVIGSQLVGSRDHAIRDRARQACDNVATQCEDFARMQGGTVHRERVGECATSLEGELARNSEAYDRLTNCMAAARSCGEVLGCGAGARLRELDGFGAGVERMRD